MRSNLLKLSVLLFGTCAIVACNSSSPRQAGAPGPESPPPGQGQGSTKDPLPPHDETTSGAAVASKLVLADIDKEVISPVLNTYREGSGSRMPEILVTYLARLADGRQVALEVPYDSKLPSEVRQNDFAQAGRLTLIEKGTGGEEVVWTAFEGVATIRTPSVGQIRVELSPLTLHTAAGARKSVAGGGYIAGRLDRSCYSVVPGAINQADGTPVPQWAPDPEWSSPFCQSKR